MKVIKVFFISVFVWIIFLFLLMGPGVVHKVIQTTEIIELNELSKYNGYTVKKLDTDWFGNWVIIKREKEEVVLKCNDSVFSELSVNQKLSQ